MRNKKYKKIIVLSSGGLDSSTLAYLAVKKSRPYLKNRVFLLTFDYGQRHKKELKSAIFIGKKIGCFEHKIIKFDLTLWGGSSLTDTKLKIPINQKLAVSNSTKGGPGGQRSDNHIPNTYVPARNTVFLSFALSYAEAVGAEEIYIGVNSIDYSGYVDCREAFIKKYQELIKVATTSGVYGKPIQIKTPLINMNKAQIVKLGKRLKVDWASTWSCYSGDKLACGLCDSCQLRLKGFSLARIKDPVKYKTYPKFYRERLRQSDHVTSQAM